MSIFNDNTFHATPSTCASSQDLGGSSDAKKFCYEMGVLPLYTKVYSCDHIC